MEVGRKSQRVVFAPSFAIVAKNLHQRAAVGEGLKWPEIQYLIFPDFLRWITSTENLFKVDRLALFAQIVDFQRRGRGHDSSSKGTRIDSRLYQSKSESMLFCTRCF